MPFLHLDSHLWVSADRTAIDCVRRHSNIVRMSCHPRSRRPCRCKRPLNARFPVNFRYLNRSHFTLCCSAHQHVSIILQKFGDVFDVYDLQVICCDHKELLHHTEIPMESIVLEVSEGSVLHDVP